MNQNPLVYTFVILLFSFFTTSLFWGKSDQPSHFHGDSHIDAINGRTVSVSPGDTLDIKSVGADLSYDITRINAKAGTELTLRYINSSEMPHNIILVKDESDIYPVGIGGLQAMDTDYVPMEMEDRMLAWTSLARPGETVYVTFSVPDPGSYPYICTYPGHFTMMQGRLVSTK